MCFSHVKHLFELFRKLTFKLMIVEKSSVLIFNDNTSNQMFDNNFISTFKVGRIFDRIERSKNVTVATIYLFTKE